MTDSGPAGQIFGLDLVIVMAILGSTFLPKTFIFARVFKGCDLQYPPPLNIQDLAGGGRPEAGRFLAVLTPLFC